MGTASSSSLQKVRDSDFSVTFSILLKHLKRLIVSIEGGFQLIADLNEYHAFITTLRQPQVTAYFSSLKMVGEIFIIDSPKDLGILVRDVTRYEGTLSTEDLYEIGEIAFHRLLVAALWTYADYRPLPQSNDEQTGSASRRRSNGVSLGLRRRIAL